MTLVEQRGIRRRGRRRDIRDAERGDRRGVDQPTNPGAARGLQDVACAENVRLDGRPAVRLRPHRRGGMEGHLDAVEGTRQRLGVEHVPEDAPDGQTFKPGEERGRPMQRNHLVILGAQCAAQAGADEP